MERTPIRRSEVSVEEYTTPNPVTANEETSIAELNVMMKEFRIRHTPIVRGTEVVGIVSERDLKNFNILCLFLATNRGLHSTRVRYWIRTRRFCHWPLV